jgi:hypothetical protein
MFEKTGGKNFSRRVIANTVKQTAGNKKAVTPVADG